MSNICDHCRQFTEGCPRCSKCHQVHFCDKQCMKAGWDEHQKLCKMIRTTPENALIATTRNFIVKSIEKKNWKHIIMCEPLLRLITFGTTHQYQQAMFTEFLIALIEEHNRVSVEVTDTKKIKYKNIMISIYQMSSDLYGEHNFVLQQGKRLMDIATNLEALKRREEVLPYLNKTLKLANDSGSFTLDSLAHTAIGQYYCRQNEIQDGLRHMQQGVDAALLNFDNDDTDSYITTSISRLLWNLFFYTEHEDNAEKVNELIEEYRTARIAMRHDPLQFKDIKLYISEIIFEARSAEVAHNPNI
jgi:tetratricopeptide (TPR) repeat protein